MLHDLIQNQRIGTGFSYSFMKVYPNPAEVSPTIKNNLSQCVFQDPQGIQTLHNSKSAVTAFSHILFACYCFIFKTMYSFEIFLENSSIKKNYR